jgi:hypothetical protein
LSPDHRLLLSDALPTDILILSNGPGELATWVQPVVRTLRQRCTDDRHALRISIVLSPCANASGQEAAIAQRFPEVDRVQSAMHFFPFLLWGKTLENWDWHARGLVLFLGGDQFFPLVIGKRLGYKTILYVEWEARWHAWGDRFAIMQPSILKAVAPQHRHKFTLVGDLMAEAQANLPDRPSAVPPEAPPSGIEVDSAGQDRAGQNLPVPSPGDLAHLSSPLIALLPGSKPLKLFPGVPLTLAIAEHIQAANPHARFVIPVAPTLELTQLAAYANPQVNTAISQFGWSSATLVTPVDQRPYLQTPAGLRVELWTDFPAYELLRTCDLCLTTVGANTAELGALTVPMLVLIPTQQLHLMKAWDGLPGLLVSLPGVGDRLARWFSAQALKRAGRFAWPNIWAQSEIVPELVGALQPAAVAAIALDYLAHPEKLQAMRTKLRQVRGEPGAAEKLVQIVQEELS